MYRLETGSLANNNLKNSGRTRKKLTEIAVSKPSRAWYFAPLILGILGGLIGYLAVQDMRTEI